MATRSKSETRSPTPLAYDPTRIYGLPLICKTDLARVERTDCNNLSGLLCSPSAAALMTYVRGTSQIGRPCNGLSSYQAFPTSV